MVLYGQQGIGVESESVFRERERERGSGGKTSSETRRDENNRWFDLIAPAILILRSLVFSYFIHLRTSSFPFSIFSLLF